MPNRKTLAGLSAALIIASITSVRADVLVQYLFWDSIGNTVGKGVQSYLDYKAERQLWSDNIAAAKQEMAACGGCPAAKAKLDKWQGIEADFQYVAGGIAASTGMSQVEADFFGIDLPPAPPPPRVEAKVVMPDWLDDRDPPCQAAVKAHLACLQEYQAQRQRQGVMTTTFAPARLIGAPCYESSRLYGHCAAEDYDAFRQEADIQKRRNEGAIIPQVQGDSIYVNVYYGSVPAEFVLQLPPDDVVLKELTDDTNQIRFFTQSQADGVLDQATIFEAHHNRLAPANNCFDGRQQREELERRVCEDVTLLTWHVRLNNQPYPILQCDYTKPGGSFRTGAAAQGLPWDPDSKLTRRYWYSQRPDVADPKRLAERHSAHPLLRVGAPRTQCPPTFAEAREVDRVEGKELAALLAGVEQVSPSVALPVPEILATYREEAQKRSDEGLRLAKLTQEFPIEGVYSFYIQTSAGDADSTAAVVRQAMQARSAEPASAPATQSDLVSGTCAVTQQVGSRYYARCQTTDGRPLSAKAQLSSYSGLSVQWPTGPLNYVVDPSDDQALAARERGRLTRLRSLTRLADLPLSGRYDLWISRGGEVLEAPCDVTPRNGHPGAFGVACSIAAEDDFAFAIHPNINSSTVFHLAGWGKTPVPELAGARIPTQAYIIADEAERDRDPAALTLVVHSVDNPDVEWRMQRLADSTDKRRDLARTHLDDDGEIRKAEPAAGASDEAVAATSAGAAGAGDDRADRCAASVAGVLENARAGGADEDRVARLADQLAKRCAAARTAGSRE